MKLFKKLLSREYVLLAAISILPLFLLYLPFILQQDSFFFLPIKEPGFYNVIRNWDGPNYILTAKSLYDTQLLESWGFLGLPATYYTAHLPLFPLLMNVIAPLTGWLYSGIIVSLGFGILLNILFYEVAKKYTKYPLFLTFVFMVFPARYLILRSVIAPETLLVFCMLLSLVLMEKGRVVSASIAGFFAVVAKFHALILFPVYAAVCIEKMWKEKKPFNLSYISILLIPTAFILICFFYFYRVGDFFAFFNAQKENELFVYFPFAQFNYANPWSNSGWLEDVVLYFFGMFLLVTSLWKTKQREWFYFALFYTLFLIIIPHRDITRYSFPLAPIFLLHFQSFFTSKTVRYALYALLPVIYFYSLNFMLTNQAPIVDWSIFK